MANGPVAVKGKRKGVASLVIGIGAFLYCVVFVVGNWINLAVMDASVLTPLLIGFFLCGLAIYRGFVSIREIRLSPGVLKGKVSSSLGVIFGLSGSLLLVLPGAVSLAYSISNPPNYEMVLQLQETPAQKVTPSIVEKTERVVSTRLRNLGVPHKTGWVKPDKIIVRLRVTKTFNEERLQAVLNPGLLSFHLVHPDHNAYEARLNAPEFKAPMGFKTVILGEKPLLIKTEPELVDGIDSAEVRLADRDAQPYIALRFRPEQARRFDDVTRDNVKRRLAIMLDEKCCSAPVIQERISGGHAQITGKFTSEEAGYIAVILRSGALPVTMRVIESRPLK